MTSRATFVIPDMPKVPRINWDVREERWARLSQDAPRVPFDKFLQQLQWNQGEHFGLIGATGRGKTVMLALLLPKHPYVVVFATKKRDPTMEQLAEHGYKKMEYWRNLSATEVPRRIIWPRSGKLAGMLEDQAEVFSEAFEYIWEEGSWTVAIDELWWHSNMLGLRKQIQILYTQARSSDLTLLAATQRPAHVPVEMYSGSTHLMFWGENDYKNLERVSEINARDKRLVLRIVENLEDYQVLYVHSRSGRMLRTRVPYAIANTIRTDHKRMTTPGALDVRESFLKGGSLP